MCAALVRTRTAIESCEAHLVNTCSGGTDIESYLTQHILVLFCAEMQNEIYKILEERSTKSGDPDISVYVPASGKRILRSVAKVDIAKFFGMFGENVKTKINSVLDDAKITVYSNAVDNRHDVAHKHGVNVTFSELKNAVDAGDSLLAAIRAALSL